MKNPSIILALLAIGALAVSLPMEWFSVQKIDFAGDQPFGNFNAAPSKTEAFSVIGSKNSIRLGVDVPITFLVIIAGAGAAMALLNRLRIIVIPVWGILIPIFFSAAYFILELARITNDKLRTPGIGIITALTATGLAVLAALTCRPKDKGGDQQPE